ncbi:MAG: MATE family efflux transporter [Bacteroidales bacterium]|nr:MATE family efflux transporter [Bacteroidales bacterium]
MKDLTTGNEGRMILKFATPMLLGNLFQQLYNIADSIIVGQVLGKEALAAVGSSFPIIFTLISLVIGVASGGTIIIAQYFGARNFEKIKSAIGTLYTFLFWASLCISVLGILSSGFIFRLIKLPEDILPQAKIYLNIYFAGMVGFFGFNSTSAILRGLGDSKTPLYFLVISTVTNIILDLLFIVVFKWGVAGAAIATVISQGGVFIAAAIYLNRTHEIISIGFKDLKFDKEIFRNTLRIGLPTGIQHTVVSLGMTFIQGIVNTFGTNVIAGYSAAIRLDSLATLPAMNFSMALSTFVGQNIGAGKTNRVKKGFTSTLFMSSIVSVLVSIVVVFLGDYLITLFIQSSEREVIRIGHEYMVIVGSFYLIFSAMFTITGVLRGAGDTLIPMFITLFSLWIIRIPVALFLSKELAEKGIWWAIPVSWGIGALFSYVYYKTGKWKNKSIVKFDMEL